MRHRVDAELAEGDAFQLAIGGMIFDPLHVAAKAVALVQDRRVPVGQPRAVVEMVAGECAEPIQMRLRYAAHLLRQMDLQQVLQRLVGAEEVLTGGVGRDGVGGLSGGRGHRSLLNGTVLTLVASRRGQPVLARPQT